MVKHKKAWVKTAENYLGLLIMCFLFIAMDYAFVFWLVAWVMVRMIKPNTIWQSPLMMGDLLDK